MVCQYPHKNQEHVQNVLSKLDSRIVPKTPDQTKAIIDKGDYTGNTQLTMAPERQVA
jgi:hypothetical protein